MFAGAANHDFILSQCVFPLFKKSAVYSGGYLKRYFTYRYALPYPGKKALVYPKKPVILLF